MLPVDVVFRNMLRSEAAESRIREKAEALAVLDPRLVHCRVVVDLPHRHHKSGDRFLVRIELSVPGSKRLLIEHGPVPDVHQAIHDGFESAKRRLKALNQKRRGAVKTHAGPNGADFDAADLWH